MPLLGSKLCEATKSVILPAYAMPCGRSGLGCCGPEPGCSCDRGGRGSCMPFGGYGEGGGMWPSNIAPPPPPSVLKAPLPWLLVELGREDIGIPCRADGNTSEYSTCTAPG